MKLSIEKFISHQKYSSLILDLFNESIICYKGNAYRAGLLFSYLAFLSILKDRILSSRCPSGYPPGAWDKLQKELLNDDKWESSLFDATQLRENLSNTPPRPAIFSISDDLRHQIKYWRDRRNDCAHNKTNLITYSHIESFWAFIESKINRITVEGSLQTYLYKLEVFYDESLTPKGADLTPLILELNEVFNHQADNNFWKLILSSIDRNYNSINPLKRDMTDFIDQIFSKSTDDICESLSIYIKNDEKLLISVLGFNSKLINLLGFTPSEVRKLWYSQINQSSYFLTIYSALLRNKLIPKDQIPEANNHLFNIDRLNFIEEEDYLVLRENGFEDHIKDEIFVKQKLSFFDYANDRRFLIYYFLQFNDMELYIAEAIGNIFNAKNYPYLAANEIIGFFKKNEIKYNLFIKLLESKNINIPKIFLKQNMGT